MTIRFLPTLIILSLLVLSCSRKVTRIAGNDSPVIFPAPPDTARIQFLTSISTSKDVKGNRKTFARFLLGEEDPIPIHKPYGIAISNGKILICDTFIHGLVIIDMKKNSFDQFIPEGKGELKQPVNCFVDKKGFLYIADAVRKQIVIFDKEFNYVNSFGEADNFKPVDVFVTNDTIWVSNLAGHQIYEYKAGPTNELISMWPEVNKESPISLFSPTNLFVTADKVFVTDFGDFKVKIYDHSGEFVDTVGSYGKVLGQFVRPKGIAVDRESNLYVVDAGFENTQIFNSKGELLMFFGGNYKGPGDMWLPAKVILDYDHLKYLKAYVDPSYKLKYLIFVTNQFGPDKINIYGAIEPDKNYKATGKKSKYQKKSRKKGPMFHS